MKVELDSEPPDTGQSTRPYVTAQLNYQRNTRALEEIAPPLMQIWIEEYNSLPNRGFTTINEQLFFGSITGRTGFIDVQTGKLKGEEDYGESCPGPPTLYGSFLYQSYEAGSYGLIAYDLVEGDDLWRVDNLFTRSSPVVVNNKVIHAALNGIISCFHYRTGDLIWRNDIDETIRNSISFRDNKIIVATLNGRVYALEYTSGIILWESDLNRPIVADPVIDTDRVYISSHEGSMSVINLNDGELIESIDFDVPLYFGPTIDQMFIYLASSDGTINVYDKQNLLKIWSFKAAGPVSDSPLVSDSYIYVTSLGEMFYILDRANGKVLQEIKLEGRPRSTPLITGDRLFISCEDNKVIAYVAQIDSL
jgi:outer membrane protein assembly factor BamB